MDALVYWLAKSVVTLVQALPLEFVARLGRIGGALAHLVDARHRRVATQGMSKAFPEKPASEIKALVREHFRRIGEAYATGVKMAGMPKEKALERCQLIGVEHLRAHSKSNNHVVAIGHFGNFEMFAYLGNVLPGSQGATTYRALASRPLNRVMEELRNNSGCLFFERRAGFRELLHTLRKGGIVLGLLTDQHAGQRGAWGDFLGMDCSTTMAPAILAHRFDAPLNVAICYRLAPARWRIEVSEPIPIYENGEARKPEAVMRDVNAKLEEAVRRDPANWFWVHRRWRARPKPRAA